MGSQCSYFSLGQWKSCSTLHNSACCLIARCQKEAVPFQQTFLLNSCCWCIWNKTANFSKWAGDLHPHVMIWSNSQQPVALLSCISDALLSLFPYPILLSHRLAASHQRKQILEVETVWSKHQQSETCLLKENLCIFQPKPHFPNFVSLKLHQM